MVPYQGWNLDTVSVCVCALQIVFLVLELGTFISGLLFGLCHLCRLRPEKLEKVSDMAHRLRVSSNFFPASAAPPSPANLNLQPCLYPDPARVSSFTPGSAACFCCPCLDPSLLLYLWLPIYAPVGHHLLSATLPLVATLPLILTLPLGRYFTPGCCSTPHSTPALVASLPMVVTLPLPAAPLLLHLPQGPSSSLLPGSELG